MSHTDCTNTDTQQLEIFQVDSRPVVVATTRTDISSNAGFLALGKIDRKLKLVSSISACFTDAVILRQKRAKCAARFQHSLNDLLAQRVFQIGLGYEDGLDANEGARGSYSNDFFLGAAADFGKMLALVP